MKKTSSRRPGRVQSNDLRREYRFDYRKARSSRFAARFREGAVAVVLDPDVASVFRSPTSVNALLRSVISALRTRERRQSKAG